MMKQILVISGLSLFLVLVTGGYSLAGEERKDETDMVHVKLVAEGIDRSVGVNDLADGETTELAALGFRIKVRRDGDMLKVSTDNEENVEGQVIMIGEGTNGETYVHVTGQEGDEVRQKHVVVMKDASGTGEKGKNILIKRKVIDDGEEKGETKVLFIGDDQSIVIDDSVIDLAGGGVMIMKNGEKVFDLDDLDSIVARAEAKSELAGSDLDNILIWVEKDVDALKTLDMEKLKCLDESDLEKISKLHAAAEEVTVYRCPEDGVTIEIPKGKDTRDKYKCPVCKTVMEKVDAPAERTFVIKQKVESETAGEE
ncbi:hypothetical protein JW905_10735 [bacterium]|nr:hypothetical protein [candidate division CSSED10-310 bacterium]